MRNLSAIYSVNYQADSDGLLGMEVDQKFLGTFAKNIEKENTLLSSMLYRILGLSVILSRHVVRARKLRKLDSTRSTPSLDLYLRIIFLTREGLRIVEQYILPMVSTFSELKVLSYKIRASFYHVYVLFHNQPSVNQTAIPPTPKRPSTPPGLTSPRPPKLDKGKAPVSHSPISESGRSSVQPTHPLEGGPVGGTTTNPVSTDPSSSTPPAPTASFLVPSQDFIPVTLACFREAFELSEKHLWGSHPLRLSVKVEFAAFLYDCMHDYEASRNLARATIAEVYNAQEGMDDDMFEDAAELVGILGRMAKRGVAGSGGGSRDGSTPRVGSASVSGSGKTIGPGTVNTAGVGPSTPTRPMRGGGGNGSGGRTDLQPPNLMAPPPKPAFPDADMVNPI